MKTLLVLAQAISLALDLGATVSALGLEPWSPSRIIHLIVTAWKLVTLLPPWVKDRPRRWWAAATDRVGRWWKGQ